MDQVDKRLLLKAQNCYAVKQYDKALENLDAIFRRTKPGARAPIQALDRRAAIYIHLRQFPEALQDSKRMIREHKTDPRGYLRTAQILRYQAEAKKDDEYIQSAIKVVASGLDKADRTNVVLYKQLSRVLEELRTIPGRKLIDPSAALPLELTLQILKSLSSNELFNTRLVSKTWNSLITGSPSLWSSVNLLNMKKPNTRGINTILNFATAKHRQCHVTKLHVGWHTLGSQPLETFRNILKKCTRLQRLRLRNWEIPKNESHLRWLDVNVPDLRSVSISIASAIREGAAPTQEEMYFSIDWIAAFLRSFPHLQQFTWRGRPQTWSLGPELEKAIDWPSQLTNLKGLHLYDMSGGVFVFPDVLGFEALKTAALNLEDLTIHEHASGARYVNQLDYSGFANLKRLDVCWSMFNMMLRVPPSLESLRFERVKFITRISNDIEVATTLLPNLKELDINELEGVEFWGKLLQESEVKLRSLRINFLLERDGDDITPIKFLSQLHQYSPLVEVEELQICCQTLENLQDGFALVISEMMPKLRKLHLKDQTALTGYGIHALAKGLPNLETLKIGTSPRANTDIIEYLQNRRIALSGVIGNNQTHVCSGKRAHYHWAPGIERPGDVWQ